MAAPTGPTNPNIPLFGPSKDEESHYSTYAIYGGALPLAVMLIALGVFTYYGYRPLGRLLTNHTYRMIVSGGLIGIGSIALLAIAYRFHKSVGFTPLERLQDLAPQKITFLENGKEKTRIVTPQMLKEEYFSRLQPDEFFILPTIQGNMVYVHVRDGFYYKMMEDQAHIRDDGFYDCNGIRCREISHAELITRVEVPKPMKRIDPLKELIPRLEADQSVRFGDKFYNHLRAGFYTITDQPLSRETTLADLLGKQPYINRECKKPDLKRDLLPRLKDNQSFRFEEMSYTYVRDGYYYACEDRTTTTVALSQLLEQVPRGHKLRELDLKRDLLPRMEDGECINFKDHFYAHIERGMWIEISVNAGKEVSLDKLLGRVKKQRLRKLPKAEQITPYLPNLRPNECIYYQSGGEANVYQRAIYPIQRGAPLQGPLEEGQKGPLVETNIRDFLGPYTGKLRDYRSISLEQLKTNKRPLPPHEGHPGGRGLHGRLDRQRIADANEVIQAQQEELERIAALNELDEEEFFDAESKQVRFED